MDPYTEFLLEARVLCEVEKSINVLPSKGGHSGLMPSKLCPDLEGARRSFTVSIQRGPNQLVDILLIGWWWGNQESVSLTLWFPQVLGLLACGQQLTSPTWWESNLGKRAERCCYVIPWGKPGPCPKAALLFLGCASLVSVSLPFPD